MILVFVFVLIFELKLLLVHFAVYVDLLGGIFD